MAQDILIAIFNVQSGAFRLKHWAVFLSRPALCRDPSNCMFRFQFDCLHVGLLVFPNDPEISSAHGEDVQTQAVLARLEPTHSNSRQAQGACRTSSV